MTISTYGCRSCMPNRKNLARMYGHCTMPTGYCPKMTTCWIIRACVCCSKLVSRPYNVTGLSVRCHTSQSAEKRITRLPMSGSLSRKDLASPRCASSRKNTARRIRSEFESRSGSTPALLLVYGLPNLSASSFSCSACSLSSLARSTLLLVSCTVFKAFHRIGLVSDKSVIPFSAELRFLQIKAAAV